MQKPNIENIRKELKARFVGLDGVIDQFVDNIRIWYEASDLMERPLIVNLWGLTGTGKTSLVRTFAELSGMRNSFIEVQFTAEKEESISHYFDEDVDENEPVILFLDEFQNFRTLSRDGDAMMDPGYEDLWLLLSDGIIDTSKKLRKELEVTYLKMLGYLKKKGTEEDDIIWIDSYSVPHLSVEGAIEFKRVFRLKDDLKEVMEMSLEDRLKLVEEALQNPNHPVFKPRVYKKLLIVISGNLNQMYEFSEDVDTFDVDPDILYNFSKTLSIVDVKSALVDKFKPEQISRLGNIHIIFPAFSRNDYYQIIRKHLNDFLYKVEQKYNLKISYDDSLVDFIFRNSVFPSQGVRPILSGLGSILFSRIPIFIENAKGDIHLYVEENRIIDKNSGTELLVDGVLDKLREQVTEDEKLLTSVHEAGHALLHSLVFKYYPHRISNAAANRSNKGITTSIRFMQNRENLEKFIITLYGGHVAEQLVFGKRRASAYAQHDLAILTKVAAEMLRKQGLGRFQFNLSPIMSMGSDFAVTDKFEVSNRMLRRLLKKHYRIAKRLIRKHKAVFVDIVEELDKRGVLQDVELDEIFRSHGITDISLKDDNKVYVGDLISHWNKFLQKA